MARIYYPTRSDEAARLLKGEGTELLAGGTDVLDRVHHGVLAPTTLVNLRRVPGLEGVREEGHALVVGARTTLLDVSEHAAVRARLPVLAEAAEHTATPQIRVLATVGGALCQRPRCVYLRHPDYRCRKQGGSVCYAMDGDNAAHALFDNELCAAVHPSTVGAALLALDAAIDVRLEDGSARALPVADFFRLDARDPRQVRKENALPDGALVEAVRVPLPTRPTLQRYLRASPRLLADWAEVEVAVCLSLSGDVIERARIVLGAVGRVPRRAEASERALAGGRLDTARIEQAARLAAEGARPLSHNAHKVALCQGIVRAALEEVRA